MNKDEEICAEITALLNYMLRSLGAKDLLKFLHRNTYLVDRYLKLKAQFKRKNQQCFKLYQRNVELEKQFKQTLNEIEKIANKQRKFDLTGKTSLIPVINEVGEDFIDILDIIKKQRRRNI